MNKNKQYVIIGNGTAGLSAAEAIRKRDEVGKITIVTEEHLTYYRIKLSEAISKEFSDRELFVKNIDWYSENNIDLLLEPDFRTKSSLKSAESIYY